jgi:hypothetical protein
VFCSLKNGGTRLHVRGFFEFKAWWNTAPGKGVQSAARPSRGPKKKGKMVRDLEELLGERRRRADAATAADARRLLLLRWGARHGSSRHHRRSSATATTATAVGESPELAANVGGVPPAVPQDTENSGAERKKTLMVKF